MPDIKKPTVLIVIDGFGVAQASDGNAIASANTPNWDRFVRTFPSMTLRASGEEVGLSWGEMGNSEVGHLAIGAGRVYYQTFPRINRAIDSGEFFQNEALLSVMSHVQQTGGALHLMGLVSGGGVHSIDVHAHALLKMAKEAGVKQVYVHAVLDGRDTMYNVGIDFIKTLQEKMRELGVGKIATLSGRFYAMDRDNRWDRTAKAYAAMVDGAGVQTEDPLGAIKASYQSEVYDEEFVPMVVAEGGQPVGRIKDGDGLIMFNFRPDRTRQIAKAFVLEEFDGFERSQLQNLAVATMVEYESGLPVQVAFGPVVIQQCLAQVISDAGLTQLHIAETEKYAHVTFFLNGTKEDPFPGEDRVIIPSPKVSSYNEAPQMSAKDIADRVVKEMRENKYDFIVMNFANPDMVGHTGDVAAAIKGVEAVDSALGKIVEETLVREGAVFITADHGNAEELKNLRTGDINKEHATNPVPFVIISTLLEGQPSIAGEVPDGDLSLMPPVGMLADVAPTVLSHMGIPQPPEMTGVPLI